MPAIAPMPAKLLPSTNAEVGGLHADRLHGRADVEHVRLLAVARGLPVVAALRAGRVDQHVLGARRREHLLRDDDRHVLRRARDLTLHPRDLLGGGRRVRDELAVARERLRLRRLLLLVLRHGLLVDPVERLAGLAVEQVQPAGLAGSADALDRLAVGVDVEQRPGRSASRSPRCRGAPPGSATSACPCRGRSRGSTRRKGCRPGDRRRTSRSRRSRS